MLKLNGIVGVDMFSSGFEMTFNAPHMLSRAQERDVTIMNRMT